MKNLSLLLIILIFLTACSNKESTANEEKNIAIKTELKKYLIQTDYSTKDPRTENTIEETANLTEEEKDYIDMVEQSLLNYKAQSAIIQDLFDEQKQHQTMVYNDQWVSELKNTFLEISLQGHLFMEAESEDGIVPIRMRKIHENMTQAFLSIGEAGEKIVENRFDTNSEGFKEGIEQLDNSRSYFLKVYELYKSNFL